MKISKTELKLMLIFGGLLVFIALYFLVYTPTLEENDLLEAEITALQPKLDELKQHEQNYDSYVTSIDEIRANIAKQLSVHPSKIENEEFLTWMIDWEQDNELDMSSVSFNGAASMAQFPLYIDAGAEVDTMVNVDAGRVTMSTAAQYSYAEIKAAINDIYAYPQSTALDNVTLTYNTETGELSGNVTISKYYISYVDAPYNKVPMPNVAVGNQNPFGTVG